MYYSQHDKILFDEKNYYWNNEFRLIIKIISQDPITRFSRKQIYKTNYYFLLCWPIMPLSPHETDLLIICITYNSVENWNHFSHLAPLNMFYILNTYNTGTYVQPSVTLGLTSLHTMPSIPPLFRPSFPNFIATFVY